MGDSHNPSIPLSQASTLNQGPRPPPPRNQRNLTKNHGKTKKNSRHVHKNRPTTRPILRRSGR